MNGKRYNEGKLKWSLVSWAALVPMVKVLMFGAQKYTSYNFFNIKDINEIVNNKWRESVNTVEKLKLFFQKGFAVNAIQSTQKENQSVLDVVNLEQLLQKEDIVSLAMSEKDWDQNLMNIIKKESIKRNIEIDPKIKVKKSYEIRSECLIQNIKNQKEEIHFLEILGNMDLQKRIIIFCHQEDVQFVKVQNDHTLTMTIQLENLEIYFVVNAIKELDCYSMMLKLLQTLLNISLSIDDISVINSGHWNWSKGLKYTEICESLQRHIISFIQGEDNDPESKLEHVGHILCNAMFLSYMYLFRKDLDDRYIDKNLNNEKNLAH